MVKDLRMFRVLFPQTYLERQPPMPGSADYRIALVAERARVTTRCARMWRDKGDPRWARHTKKESRQEARLAEIPECPVGDSELGEEAKRLGSMARKLAGEVSRAKGQARSALITDYTRVIDSMRKLRNDRPGIEEREGSMVPVDEAEKIIAARDEALLPLLRSLPGRLAPVCANRAAAEVQQELEAEVKHIMNAVEARLSAG